jgi:hypothetical protein
MLWLAILHNDAYVDDVDTWTGLLSNGKEKANEVMFQLMEGDKMVGRPRRRCCLHSFPQVHGPNAFTQNLEWIDGDRSQATIQRVTPRHKMSDNNDQVLDAEAAK